VGVESDTLRAFSRSNGVVRFRRRARMGDGKPPLTCDVCGDAHRSVRRVERDELKSTAAPWIKVLCSRCIVRLGRTVDLPTY